MKIYCCGCGQKVRARLTNGEEVYPHRKDLSGLPFWVCDSCGNYVGCHHKTKNRTAPLGCIPTPEIRQARTQVHQVLDPLWRSGEFTRGEVYKAIGDKIGQPFHTANIKSVKEADDIKSYCHQLKAGDVK